ncbi:unnamed protein product [Dicrocoelium dendriticum]|nr:unnamed protein product [Dicrocoelium dendriticum]
MHSGGDSSATTGRRLSGCAQQCETQEQFIIPATLSTNMTAEERRHFRRFINCISQCEYGMTIYP